MTTNTANSQAASIADDNEFHDALMKWLIDGDYHIEDGALICKGWDGLIACLDAKLAQARAEALREATSIADDIEFWNLIEAYGAARGPATKENLALCAYIDARLAQAREEGRLDGYNKGWADASLTLIKAESRATAAESRLAEIRRGVENLKEHNAGLFLNRDDVLELLGLPIQSDISGLPG